MIEHLPRRAVTRWIGAAVLVLTPLDALAASRPTDFATTFPAVLALLIFFVAYSLVIVEEITGVRKSIPMLLAAGSIWALVAVAAISSRVGSRCEPSSELPVRWHSCYRHFWTI